MHQGRWPTADRMAVTATGRPTHTQRASLHNGRMAEHPDWNDLKIFLTVARAGTVSRAGELLEIEHSTVSRRIDRLEAQLDTVLFDRRRSGYVLTRGGDALVAHAEAMESALLAALEAGSERGQHVRGNVRVGTPEAFGIVILTPTLARFREQFPEVNLELMAQPQFPSLVTREVEILVTLDPPEMGRYKIAKLADIDYFLYASPAYLKGRPPIREVADLAEHVFIDYIHDGHVSERYRVLEELVAKPRRRFTTTSVLAQRAAAVAGLGLVLLTPYVATMDTELVCVFPDCPLIHRRIWIAAPEDLLRIRRYRCVWDHIRHIVAGRPELFH